MNDRQLRSFIAAAEKKSFSKAAQDSYISTPALIQQIDLLESSIGFELFYRTNRGVELTPGGKQFLDKAKAILALYESAVRQGLEENSQIIRVGIPQGQCPALLLRGCRAYIRKHGNSSIQYVPVTFNGSIDAIEKYQTDVTLIAEPTEQALKGLRFLPLLYDTLSFGMDASNALSSECRITPDQLQGKEVMLGNYPYLKYPFEKTLADTGAHFVRREGENNLGTMLDSTLNERLLVFFSQWANAFGTYLHVVPSNIKGGMIGLIYRKQAEPVLADFIACMKEQLK